MLSIVSTKTYTIDQSKNTDNNTENSLHTEHDLRTDYSNKTGDQQSGGHPSHNSIHSVNSADNNNQNIHENSVQPNKELQSAKPHHISISKDAFDDAGVVY